METTTRYRTCPLCEATCGVEIETRGRPITSIRGDHQDPFSRGYICPKGPALKHVDTDPDRLRRPMIRRGTTWQEVGWDDAFAEIDRRLPALRARHGKDAVAVYLGNPSVHTLALTLYPRALLRVLGTRSIFPASTVDQMPKHLSAGLMFGTPLSIPVPDVDRTQYLLILGADPVVSNGSLMTAPDIRERLRAIRARGGKIVVVDPRRSRTAEDADVHHFIRPGTDALLLFAIVQTLFAEGLVRLGRLAEHTHGVERVAELARPFTPEAVAPGTGVPADVVRRLARELAAAESAAVYGRVGTCQQEFGTLASWLVDVVNALTGNLDRPGGAMFTRAAAGAANTHGTPGRGKGFQTGRRRSRVRGFPEVMGELPCACLAEEIETPGEGQIRGLITIAGNPVLSTPNGYRLARALAGLDFMVSLDIYLNETTRHAHVILPGLSPHGDGLGARPAGLSLAVREAHPHGVDLGPLEPRIPEVLRTPSGAVELAPDPIVADVPRLRAALARKPNGLVLVGRRDLRSNNSWMHNVENLVRGRERCTMQVHPEDAAALGLVDGAPARVRSRAGTIEVPVEVTPAMMRGVASVPHGCGHDAPGTRRAVAAAHAGVNCNLLADEQSLDPLSGNAILNGTPITVEPAH